MECTNLYKANTKLRGIIIGPWDQILGLVALDGCRARKPFSSFFYIQSFLSGVKTSFNILWPLIYSAWLGKDINLYLNYSELNPNMSTTHLVSGMRADPVFKTTQKGIDFYGTNSYTHECLALTLPFLIFGMLNLIRWKVASAPRFQPIINDQQWAKLNLSISSGTKNEILISTNQLDQDPIAVDAQYTMPANTEFNLPFGTNDLSTILRARRNIISTRNKSDALEHFSEVESYNDQPLVPLDTKKHGLAYLFGTSEYDLMDWLQYLSGDSLQPENGSSHSLTTRMQDIANSNKASLGVIYLRFLLWRRGDHVHNRDNVFMLYSAFQYYFLIQWLKLMYNNYVRIPTEYHKERQKCDNLGMQWVLQPLIDKYQCSECASWDFIELRDNNSTQACFHGLMEQSFPPEELIERLKILSTNAPISHCDLSNLNWIVWSENVLQQVQSSIAHLGWVNTTFSLAGDGTPLNDGIFKTWCAVLAKIKPISIKLYNIPLDNNNIHTLQTMPWWNDTISLSLSHCMLDDVSATQLFEVMPKDLRQIDISYNQLSESSIQTLLMVNSSKIDYIDLAHNNIVFTTPMLSALFKLAGGSLILDHNKIGSDSRLTGGTTIFNASLTNLSLSHCEIDEFTITQLMRTINRARISRLSLAYNQLGDICSAIITETPLPFLTDLNYSGNQGLNPHFGLMRDGHLSWPNLKVLDMSSTSFTDETLNYLNNLLQKYNLSSLAVNHAQLLDKDIKILLKNTSSYQALSVNYNHLSSQSLQFILPSMTESPQLLSLAGISNAIESDAHLSNINTLNLADTKISAELASELVDSEKIKILMLERTVMPGGFLSEIMLKQVNNVYPAKPWLAKDQALSTMQVQFMNTLEPLPAIQLQTDNFTRSQQILACRVANINPNFQSSQQQSDILLRTCITSAATAQHPSSWLLFLVILIAIHNCLIELPRSLLFRENKNEKGSNQSVQRITIHTI